ncbi:MAG: CDP-archaeol synthase [Hyphomonadaceae bacterium]|nr:CDP-archaeol synthase [Hyphomonadaceae bacterium]
MNAPADASEKPKTRDLQDILPRTLSAIVLIPLGLAVAWFGGPWLAAAAGACALAMSYEWARMSEPDALTGAFLFSLAGSLGAVMFASWGQLDWGLGWLALCAGVSAVRRRTIVRMLETAGGALYIGAPAACFLWLRARDPGGFEIIILLFTTIWAADVGAYFAGRLIGGPKLIERLSPQKTWSGLVAGIAAGAGAGAANGHLFGAPSLGEWAAAGASLALIGLVGDLIESLIKRRFGVKDASRLIPGHGGVLDRLDGLMAATLATSAFLVLCPSALASLLGR